MEVVAHNAIRVQHPAEPPATLAQRLRECQFAPLLGEDPLPVVAPVAYVVNPSLLPEPKFARHGRDGNPPPVQMSRIT